MTTRREPLRYSAIPLFGLLVFIFLVCITPTAGCSREESVESASLRKPEPRDSSLYFLTAFHSFPGSFETFIAQYGFKGFRYMQYPEEIDMFFESEKWIPEVHFINKVIDVSLGGQWIADAAEHFQSHMRQLAAKKTGVFFDLVSQRPVADQISFFHFFFDELRPQWKEVPEVFAVVKENHPAMFKLMDAEVKKIYARRKAMGLIW